MEFIEKMASYWTRSVAALSWTGNTVVYPLTATYSYLKGQKSSDEEVPAQPPAQPPAARPTWTARALNRGAHAIGGYIPQAAPVLQAMLDGAIEEKERAEARALETQYCQHCREELVPEASEKRIEEEEDEELGAPPLLQTLLSHLEGDYAWLIPSFMISSFAVVMRNFVTGLIDSTQHALHCRDLHEGFTSILEDLTAFLTNKRDQEDEGVQELTSILRRILRLLRNNPQLHIYANGIRLPDLAPSTKSVSSEKLDDLLQKNLSGLEEEAPAETLSLEEKKRLLDEEKERFIQNTTHFLTTKIFHETICRLDLPDKNKIYFNLARGARGDNPNQALKAAINGSLREHEVNAFLRGIVYLTYPLISYLLERFVQRLISICYEEITTYIEENTQNEDRIAEFKNTLLMRLTSFLSIDQGVYRTIAHPETVMTGSIQEMRCHDLDSQESNQGYTSRELYTACAEILIQKCTGNFFLSWLFRNIIGNKDTLVEALINNSVSSIVDAQGYTHALNTLLIQQLEEALTKLRRSSSSESDVSDFSEKKKEELVAFVKNLFEDLKLNRAADTIPELRAALEPNGLKEAVDNMITEEVIASITHTLASLISSMLSEEKLVDLALQFTRTINQIYDEPGEGPTEEEIKHTEARVSLLAERLIDLSVTQAIQEKMELGPLREQQEINRQIRLLQEEVHGFASKASESLETTGIKEPPFEEAQTALLQKLIQETKHHIIRLTRQLSEVRTLPIPEQSRSHLENLYNQVTHELTPYRKALKHLEQHHSNALRLQSLKRFLEQLQADHEQLAPLIDHSSEEIRDEVTTYQQRSLLYQALLLTLRRSLNAMRLILPPEFKDAIDTLINAPLFSILPLQTALAQVRFAKAQEGEESLIRSIHQRKKQALEQRAQVHSTSDAIRMFFLSHNPVEQRALTHDIQRLRTQNARYGADRLNGILDALTLRSDSAEEIDEQLEGYLTALQAYKEEKEGLFEAEKEKTIRYHQEALENVSGHLETLAELLETAYEEVEETLSETQKQIEQITLNSQPVDPPLYQAKIAAEAFYQLMIQPHPLPKKCTAAFEHLKSALEALGTPIEGIEWITKAEIPSDPEEKKEWVSEIMVEWSSQKTSGDFFNKINDLIDKINIQIEEASTSNAFLPQSYANIKLFDLHLLQNTAAYVVASQVESHIDGLKIFIRQPTTYKYALHHLVLIPYAQQFQFV